MVIPTIMFLLTIYYTKISFFRVPYGVLIIIKYFSVIFIYLFFTSSLDIRKTVTNVRHLWRIIKCKKKISILKRIIKIYFETFENNNKKKSKPPLCVLIIYFWTGVKRYVFVTGRILLFVTSLLETAKSFCSTDYSSKVEKYNIILFHCSQVVDKESPDTSDKILFDTYTIYSFLSSIIIIIFFFNNNLSSISFVNQYILANVCVFIRL